MSRKRGKKRKPAVEAIPVDILAEGSGPVGRAEADVIATVGDIVTTEDIATTEDVVTADQVVATAGAPAISAAGDASERHDLAGEAGDAAEHLGLASDGPSLDAEAGTVGEAAPEMMAEVMAEATDVASRDAASPDAASPDAAEGEAEGDGEDVAGLADTAAAGGDGEIDGDQDEDVVVFPTSAATMDAVQLKHLVEALIFASDRPLTIQRLRQLTRVGDVRRLEQALAEITEDYRERGLILQQVSGGYQFRTRTQFSAWVQQLIAGRPVRLSRAQLETLAIVAYRQPITRPEIDDIRGVDSSATLKLLIDRMLIRVLGKREEVGRPMLYGTTKEFLDFFSLGDLRELPTLREYSELTAESRKVMSDRLGLAPEGGPGPEGGPEGGEDGDGGGGGSGEGGGGEGGDGSGGASGEGGGGPIPGFPSDTGTVSDDGGAPANATASDLAEAVATFFSAADAVERSNAAAVAEPDDLEPTDGELADELSGDEAENPVDASQAREAAPPRSDELASDELASDELASDELASDDVSDPGDGLLASAAAPPRSDELAGGEVGGAMEGLAASESVPPPVDGDGRVDGDAGWPAGSQRIAVIASIDDRPVERPVMESHVIGADVLADSPGDAASAAALHAEPAAE